MIERKMISKGGEKLALAIKATPKIQKLSISCHMEYSGEGMTDKGLYKIRERLGKVTSLQTIQLNFFR